MTAPAALAVSRDPLTILLGFQTRASTLIADMQAAAKATSDWDLAKDLTDCADAMDDALNDSINVDVARREAADDAVEDAREAKHEAELRSDYYAGVI